MTAENTNKDKKQVEDLPPLTKSQQEELEKIQAEAEPFNPIETAQELIASQNASIERKNIAVAIIQAYSTKFKTAKPDESDELIHNFWREVNELYESTYYSDEDEDLYESTKNTTLAQDKEEAEQSSPAIATDLYFYGISEDIGYERERLELPAGAITLVCAPTGHGKSRILVYLSMQALQHGKDEGTVLYFSVEESAQSIKRKFVNMYVNEKLNHDKNNTKIIREYMATPNPTEEQLQELFNEIADNETDKLKTFKTFKEKQQDFYDRFMDTDRLRIIYERTRSVDRIAKTVLAIQAHQPIKAVFIDYIQRLQKKGNYNANAKELLKAVTNDLMTLSIETQVPFVIAVQFNRDVYSPIEMDLQNIAEASEIEFAANQAILCWNSKIEHKSKSTKWASTKKKGNKDNSETVEELTQKAKEFEERTGMTIGDGGKMYLQMAKSREGATGLECILDVISNTGAMTQNTEEHKWVQEWEKQDKKYKATLKNTSQQSFSDESFKKTSYNAEEPPTKRPKANKSFSQMRQEAQAQKKAEKQAQAEAPADTEETTQPQQEGITRDGLEANMDEILAKQKENTNILGETDESDNLPF